MNKLRLFLLTFGVFGIVNAEQGIVGLLPMVAERYGVGIPTAGLLVSMFALGIALSGATLPPLLSGIDRKKVMVASLGVFLACNLAAAFAPSFAVALAARVLPAFFHPVYISMALSVAARSASPQDAPKAVSRVMIGVSAAMVLGAPVASFLANALSLRAAMLYFALVNALALALAILFFPRMPVSARLSYGAQLGALRKPDVWLAIIGVILLNGGVFGSYGYLSEYLSRVTRLPGGAVSLTLMAFGLASVPGNPVAGRLLSKMPRRALVLFPVLMGAVHIALLLAGRLAPAAVALVAVWGFFAGAGGNVYQYRFAVAAPEAPDFANGMFLTAANIGVTIGSTVCGFFIAGFGVRSIGVAGMLFLSLALGVLLLGFRRADNR